MFHLQNDFDKVSTLCCGALLCVGWLELPLASNFDVAHRAIQLYVFAHETLGMQLYYIEG